MAEAEASTRAEPDSDECLHCAIIDLVDERIAAGSADAANLVVLIAESLVDVILLVPQAEQAQLMAHTLSVRLDNAAHAHPAGNFNRSGASSTEVA
jgi:hypothetical protein